MRDPNIFKKDLYYYDHYFCNYYCLIIVTTVATDNDDEINKKISKTLGAVPKKFPNLAPLFPYFKVVQGIIEMYGLIGTYISHENVYNSFLDA